ncbi:MAG: glycosyl hydrolase, partial [Anaerovorax sp.]
VEMEKTMFEKIIIRIVLLLLVVASLFFLVNACEERFRNQDDDEILQTEQKVQAGKNHLQDQDSLVYLDDVNNQFSNHVDGYTVAIPKEFGVDRSNHEIVTVLGDSNWQMAVYKQELSTDVKPESYIQYSNQFIENRVDHKKEREETLWINGHEVHLLQWSREALPSVAQDKNHYAVCDIIINDWLVYTLSFKSTESFGAERDYIAIVNSFQLCKSSKKGEKIQRKQEQEVVKNTKWSEKTNQVFKKYFSQDSPLTWGIFEPCAPEFMQVLHEMEGYLDYEFPFLISYQHFTREGIPENLQTMFSNAKKEEKILELSLQTTAQNSTEGNMVYDILKGEFDEYIDQLGATIKDYKMPVLMRFCNEMNGDWCVYSAYHTGKDTEIYKAFYTYIYTIFQEVGVDNVIWIWNPNARSFPDFKWNHELCYFPGNAYVDVVGMTAYNTGTYYEGELWESFSQLYDETYESYARKYKLPLMITEFASSSVGGDKAKWITQMFQHMKTYDHLKVALWWSNCDLDGEGNIARPYFIDESDEILDAFREGLREYK